MPERDEWTLRARWVFPADGPPLPDGRVTVRGERIVSVGPTGRADHDLGNVALLPGFVNAHTHLDLGAVQGRCPPTPDFPAWLRRVRAARHALTDAEVRQGVAEGIAACLRYGTTLLGDITAFGNSGPHLAEAPLRSVVFYELLGLSPERVEQARGNLAGWLQDFRPTELCQPGVSPHAPYSVHRELFADVARLAAPRRLPVAVHLAESPAELELLAAHAGPFVPFLQELSAWDPTGLIGHPAKLVEVYRDVPTLFVHGNYLPADFPLSANQSIVYCPRTHAAFGHTSHPCGELLARGVRVALGTDSLASNPDLDILAEARFLHARCPGIPGAALLRMLTLSGAEALGRQQETGSLTPGKSADLVVLPLPDEGADDPHRLLWESPKPVQAVLLRGRWQK